MTVIEQFEREYQEYHGISLDRRRRQSKLLRELRDRAGKEPHECDPSDLKSLLTTFIDAGDHVNNVRFKLNLLKPFFSWAWEAGLIDADRLMAIRRVAPPNGANGNGLPRPYSRKELVRFRAELDKRWPEADPKWWKRWRNGTSRFKRIQTHVMRVQIEAIIALALHCGLRRAEIYHGSIDDFHYDNQYVVVRHGKGGREREVPHTTTSREAMRAWIELRTELGPKHDALWLSLAHEGIALKAMRWDRFRKLLLTIKRGPDDGSWRYHRFRHTAGTEWLRAIKRIEIVSRLLGHSNVTQTLGYAAIVRDDLHDAVAKAEREFEESVAA